MSDLRFEMMQDQDLIQERLDYLNDISADIRLLEKHLQGAAICKDIDFPCENGIVMQWHHKKGRLCIDNRPLIEHKVGVRVIAHKYLLKFYEKIQDYLDNMEF